MDVEVQNDAVTTLSLDVELTMEQLRKLAIVGMNVAIAKEIIGDEVEPYVRSYEKDKEAGCLLGDEFHKETDTGSRPKFFSVTRSEVARLYQFVMNSQWRTPDDLFHLEVDLETGNAIVHYNVDGLERTQDLSVA